MSAIYEYGIHSRVQESQRNDGQWFRRYQDRTPYGYRWGAWRPCHSKDERAVMTERKARLPK